ncbi:hypothetical protein EDD86DRAFT_216211 [Gorgonomyces haynaldii]|nr:hypothetical protein EDD86DRAFT_216211 [Gorgonomyces haynaldii]
MKEVHEREIKNQRELWQAAEKIKRDKWIQDKTKAIKEATIKGLEPEIQNLIAQHKIQLRQAEENYRQQLSKEKQFLMEQQQRQLEAYAEKATSDRQKACEEEREFARQRYQKQLERDEMEFAQQKRKMMAEFDDQKHHLTESFKIERMQDETSHKRQIQDLQREMDQMRSDREKALEDARKRHLQELQQQREKLTIEREEWQSQYIKKIENEVKTREMQVNTLKQRYEQQMQQIVTEKVLEMILGPSHAASGRQDHADTDVERQHDSSTQIAVGCTDTACTTFGAAHREAKARVLAVTFIQKPSRLNAIGGRELTPDAFPRVGGSGTVPL